MPCPDRLSQWSQQVSTAFGHLSKPQMCGLVRMSARGSRCREQQGLRKSVLCSHWYWNSRNKRCFNACASGIWTRNTKAGKSGGN